MRGNGGILSERLSGRWWARIGWTAALLALAMLDPMLVGRVGAYLTERHAAVVTGEEAA